ncbi:T9SS type A sorting domain-containing protein [Algibacter luteus]|uniref:Por secretion system C-terminal sorting domain-containing protein n=1 Tax=Algibacter luteus TaxID=1178825 RepID=A0A1M6AGS4_9FLAO|nr:T9SS type A sorting domain-containing protein [Algibacter luteus]SHI35736.1 Por secretion system C-terminal sorting domain-containing protein [Algibacter luteus]
MKIFTFLKGLLFLTITGALAQAPNNGFYVNSIEKDVFKIPDSDVINKTQINNRTYETYFYANSTVARQFIFMEGEEKRGVLAYIEGGYIIAGAYCVDNDYANLWTGTYFRKAISANTWYHIALVFDNLSVPNPTPAVTAMDNTNFKWYLDGVLHDQKAGFQIGGNGDHNNLNIGLKDDKLQIPTALASWIPSGLSEYSFGEQIEEGGGDENYFDGYLWGFRVWNSARTAAEINDNKSKLILQSENANLLAVLDGDTVTYLDNNSLPDVRDSEGGLTVKEWEGNTDTNWTTATNWKNDLIPDNTKQEPVLIKKGSTYFPEINTTVVVGDIELEADGTNPGEITIQDGGTLAIAYDLLNDGILIVEDNGSLEVRESSPISGVGSLNINRDTSDYPSDFYTIWSTPVSSPDSQFSSIFTNDVIIYEYDASQNPSAYVQLPKSANMEVGKGYFIRSDHDSGVITRSFSGVLNNGNIDIPIYYNSPTDMDNLIGNPYASAIDWRKFYEDNSDVLEGTMHYWVQSYAGVNNSVNDFKSYNYGTGPSEPGISEFIPAGLGVFVNATQAGTATFRNAHKVVGNNDQFFKSNNEKSNKDDGKSWIKLSGSMGYSPILIGFIPGATNDYESQYDGVFINHEASIKLYSLINNNKYVIQGRSVLNENNDNEIPLGFQVNSAGNYSISIMLEYIDTNFDIILEDKLLGINSDLRNADYNFNVSSAVEDNNRFVLHFVSKMILSTTDFEDINSIRSFFVNNQLITTTTDNENPITIQLWDVLGQQILDTPYNNSIRTQNINPGVYILKYTYNNTNAIMKKIVKK